MKPIRVQRKRVKGWRKPGNTVYVGRGSRWGNPFYVTDDMHPDRLRSAYACGTADDAVKKYAKLLFPYHHHSETSGMGDFLLSEANIYDVRKTLSGKNLMCWCPLDAPCHADILLEMANEIG